MRSNLADSDNNQPKNNANESFDNENNSQANQMPDAIDFYDVDTSTYPKAYHFLKQQREQLETIYQQIKDEKENLVQSDKQTVDFLEFITESLLMCDFGAVFLSSSNSIPALQNIIKSSSGSQAVISLASRLLAISLRLSRIFSIVSCTMPSSASVTATPTHNKSKPIKEDNKQIDNDNTNDPMLVLCRICEEYVPIDMIEQHSKSCVIAYESEFTMINIDERIKKLQKAIRNSVLNVKWPGSPSKSISTLLPMLHVIMLLDIIVKGDKNEASCAAKSLTQLELPEEASPNAQSLFQKSKELLQEKIKVSNTYDQASKVLQKTRVSGSSNGAPSLQTTIADFNFIKRISSGAFAKVFLAVKNTTGDVYAIKVTPKSSVKQKNQFRRVLTEKDILLLNSNPFIVDFYYSIIGAHNLYLVMEYLPGGDLYSLLQHVGALDESDARTYTAQIVKALQYLRTHGIIHRDLKPDNILITYQGKLKLTDFGLSLYGAYDRSIADDNKSIVGTPDYLAPEIILSQTHSYAADYWSLGCVIYEFVVGEPPFHRATESETFGQILSGVYDTSYLDDFSDELKDLIKKLLTIDPAKRLGANSIQEIMDHPWFSGLDWDNIDKLDPVFVPEQKDKFNVSYFTERYTFSKTDDIEKDIMDDIEQAKTQTPHSVSMTDLSAESSFTQRSNGEEDFTDGEIHEDDVNDDMMMFPSIALKNLSKRTFYLPTPDFHHKRSNSVEKKKDSGPLVRPPAVPLALGVNRSLRRKTETPPPFQSSI